MVLENQQHYLPNFLRAIARYVFSKTFSSRIKVGRWSRLDKEKVVQNFEELKEETEITESDVRNISDLSEEDKLKWIIAVGYPCSRGLSYLRDPCEVVNRLRILLSTTGGWSRLEDKKLLELVDIHGNNWTTIGNEMKRTTSSVYGRYVDKIKHGDKIMGGYYSVDEDEKILRTVFAKNPNLIRDGIVEKSPIIKSR